MSASQTYTPGMHAEAVASVPPASRLLQARLDQSALLISPTQVLHHIHEKLYPAESFNPGHGNGRFHPIVDTAGILVPIYYSANTEIGAYCETLFRAVDPSGSCHATVPGQLVWRHAYAQVRSNKPLQLANLAGDGLRQLGITRAALLEPGISHYAATAAWAQAIHHAYPELHGLAWVSRQHDLSLCYMFFGDRVSALDLQAYSSIDLAGPVGRQSADLAAQRLGIIITR